MEVPKGLCDVWYKLLGTDGSEFVQCSSSGPVVVAT